MPVATWQPFLCRTGIKEASRLHVSIGFCPAAKEPRLGTTFPSPCNTLSAFKLKSPFAHFGSFKSNLLDHLRASLTLPIALFARSRIQFNHHQLQMDFPSNEQVFQLQATSGKSVVQHDCNKVAPDTEFGIRLLYYICIFNVMLGELRLTWASCDQLSLWLICTPCFYTGKGTENIPDNNISAHLQGFVGQAVVLNSALSKRQSESPFPLWPANFSWSSSDCHLSLWISQSERSLIQRGNFFFRCKHSFYSSSLE